MQIFNNISFSVQYNTSLPYNLARENYPEFSFYNCNEDEQHGESYLVKSNLLDDKDSNEILFSKIKTLSHFFLGACNVVKQNSISELPYWSDIYRNGAKVTPSSYKEIPFYGDFKTPKYTKSEVSKFTNDRILQYLALALRDEIFARILLFASDRYEYIEMYKILDTVKSTPEAQILTKHTSQLDCFGYTSNNFTASGFASRHGKAYGKTAQNKFISINDSRILFESIISDIFEERRKTVIF